MFIKTLSVQNISQTLTNGFKALRDIRMSPIFSSITITVKSIYLLRLHLLLLLCRGTEFQRRNTAAYPES